MNCLNCGKEKQARMKVCSDCFTAFKELDRINFLEEWLSSHETQVGASICDLLDEVQNQRARLFELPTLKQFYTKTSHQIALLSMVLDRVPVWGQAVNLKPASLNLIQECIQQSIKQLIGKLHIKSVPKLSLSEIEILDYAITAIHDWIDTFNFTARDAHMLRSYLENQREAEYINLAKQLALHQSILDLFPIWMKEGQIPAWFSHKLETQLKSQNQLISASLAGRPSKVKPPSRLETLTYILNEIPVWVGIMNISCEDPAVVQILNYLSAQYQAMIQPTPTLQPVRVARDISSIATPISVPTRSKQEISPAVPAAPIRSPRPPKGWPASNLLLILPPIGYHRA